MIAVKVMLAEVERRRGYEASRVREETARRLILEGCPSL